MLVGLLRDTADAIEQGRPADAMVISPTPGRKPSVLFCRRHRL